MVNCALVSQLENVNPERNVQIHIILNAYFDVLNDEKKSVQTSLYLLPGSTCSAKKMKFTQKLLRPLASVGGVEREKEKKSEESTTFAYS